MAATETEETATVVQPTVSTNSSIEPAVTVIEPDTGKVTEVAGETTRTAEPLVVVDEADAAKSMTVQGEPNGLPPAAPGIQLQPPLEVKALREWEHMYLKHSVHSTDPEHMHLLHQHVEAIVAKLHSKYPVPA